MPHLQDFCAVILSHITVFYLNIVGHGGENAKRWKARILKENCALIQRNMR